MTRPRTNRSLSPGIESFESRTLPSMALGIAQHSATNSIVESESIRHPVPSTSLLNKKNLTYETVGGLSLKLDTYAPASPAPLTGRPVILAIHGGGWHRFDKADYGRAVSVFTRAGYLVVAIDYRLSTPSQPSWPAAFDDVRAAVIWVRQHAAQLQADPNRIVAMGESAGAHLAELLGANPQDPPGSPISARVQAVVDFYGPADLIALDQESIQGSSALRQFLGGVPAAISDSAKAASPIDQINPNSAPTLIVQGLSDTVVPADQSEALSIALAAAGVRHQLILIPGASHGFRFRVGRLDLIPDVLAFLSAS